MWDLEFIPQRLGTGPDALECSSTLVSMNYEHKLNENTHFERMNRMRGTKCQLVQVAENIVDGIFDVVRRFAIQGVS